ncbi:MAG: gliding motility-associated C-terminal domain-containing protein, partial [Flavobacteriales bacterium]|nr:gliding motility-associated C-terminal domain-containing protein [Flavobacteriales bacterium]
TYDVTLTITSSVAAGGCTNSTTYPNYITIHQNPTADFYMKDNPANMLNPIVSFHDQSYFNIVGWAWDIGGLDSSYIQNPTYEFPVDTGHYPITLTVIDDNGCIGTITKILEVEGEFGIYVPNAFTPDFDFLNEGFGPKGFGISEINYSFFVFDRWGEIIFESHTLFEEWNGTYKGNFVQNGVYVWKLEFQDINGKKHSRIGHVNVIR